MDGVCGSFTMIVPISYQLSPQTQWRYAFKYIVVRGMRANAQKSGLVVFHYDMSGGRLGNIG